jgi:hypothetical protein
MIVAVVGVSSCSDSSNESMIAVVWCECV